MAAWLIRTDRHTIEAEYYRHDPSGRFLEFKSDDHKVVVYAVSVDRVVDITRTDATA